MPLQPLFQVLALRLFEFNTVLHAFQALLQCALGTGRPMDGEKLFHIVAHEGGAEAAQSGNGAAAANVVTFSATPSQ